MPKVKLDRIDRKILSGLQDDGRITNVDLAERAGISAPPCLRRVRALERGGYIRGYHAHLDPERLGFEIVFFVLVGLESQADARLRAFEAEMAEWPEVRECHMVRGGGDFLLKIVARNAGHENTLTRDLTALSGVERVTTLQVIRSSKVLPGVPIEGIPEDAEVED